MRKKNLLEKILIKIGGSFYTDLDLERITNGNKKIPMKELWLILLMFLLPILLYFILVK